MGGPVQVGRRYEPLGMRRDWNGLLVSVEGVVHGWLVRHSIDVLRVAMGLVFLGFGVLKFFPGSAPRRGSSRPRSTG